jgi:cytochrome c peroxidase
MYDGRFSTLREVIDHHDHGVQISPLIRDAFGDPVYRYRARLLHLTESQELALEAFLHILTDEGFLFDPRFSGPFH